MAIITLQAGDTSVPVPAGLDFEVLGGKADETYNVAAGANATIRGGGGADIFKIAGSASDYTAERVGSSLVLTDANGKKITIPMTENDGDKISFAGGTEVDLKIDGTDFKLGSQTLTTTAVAITGASDGGGGGSTTPTFSLSSSGTSVDEGASAVFTLTTTNVDDGTDVPYEISGVDASDVTGGLTGTATVNGGTATITVPIVADLLTDPNETLMVSLTGKSPAVTESITINDTSTTVVPLEVMTDDLFNNRSPSSTATTINVVLDDVLLPADGGPQSGSDNDTNQDETAVSVAGLTALTDLTFTLDDIVDTGDFNILAGANFNNLKVTLDIGKTNLQNDYGVSLVNAVEDQNDLISLRSFGHVELTLDSDTADAAGLSGNIEGLGGIYIERNDELTVTTANSTNVLNTGQLGGGTINNGGIVVPHATTVNFNTDSGAIKGMGLSAPAATTLNINAHDDFSLFGTAGVGNDSNLSALKNLTVTGDATAVNLTGTYTNPAVPTPINYTVLDNIDASGFTGGLFTLDLTNEVDTNPATVPAEGATIQTGDAFTIISGTGAGDTVTNGANTDIWAVNTAGDAGVTTNGGATLTSGGTNNGMDIINGFSATSVAPDVIDFAGIANTLPGNAATNDVSNALNFPASSLFLSSNAGGILTLSGTKAADVDTLAEWVHIIDSIPFVANQAYGFEFDNDTYIVNDTINGVGGIDLVKLEGVSGVTTLVNALTVSTIPAFTAAANLNYLSNDQVIDDTTFNLQNALTGIGQDHAVLIM